MSRGTHYLRAIPTIVLLLILPLYLPIQARAATAPLLAVSDDSEVIITEVQTTGDTASQEFIELYNLTDTDVDFADTAKRAKEVWKLQLFSSASVSSGAPDWTKPSVTVALSGSIMTGGYYLLSSAAYSPGSIEGDQSYSARLSDSGGALQLITVGNGTTTVHDRLIWQEETADKPLPSGVMASPPKNGSLQRVVSDEQTYRSNDGSLTDFVGTESITPKEAWQPVVDEEPVVVPDIPTENGGDPGTEPPVANDNPNGGFVPPYITELLPNPAAPLTDDADEYIELYNPNDAAFNLKDYRFEVGVTTVHEFIFTEEVYIPPLSQMAFYARDTNLTLSNTAGRVRLLDPQGVVLHETTPYASAKEGSAWALSDGQWQWTTTATPGSQNAMTMLAVAATTKPATAKPAVKKATAKTASAKVKGASTTKKAAKKPKAKKAEKPKLAAAQTAYEKPPRSPIHTGVLVAVGVAALLYAAYEYRNDISNRLYKLGHNRAVRFITRR